MAKKLPISGTDYLPILVWDGDYHEISVRVLDRREATRWELQRALQNAGGFRMVRRVNKSAARNRRRHHRSIGRRDLARRFLIQVEPLVAAARLSVTFDGERVRVWR